MAQFGPPHVYRHADEYGQGVAEFWLGEMDPALGPDVDRSGGAEANYRFHRPTAEPLPYDLGKKEKSDHDLPAAPPTIVGIRQARLRFWLDARDRILKGEWVTNRDTPY